MSVAGVLCRRSSVSGRHVISTLHRLLCPRRRSYSQLFTINIGLRKGCVMSPLLFTAYVLHEWIGYAITRNLTEMALLEAARSTFFYGQFDQIVSSRQGLQHILDKFSVACDQAGMKNGNGKTDVICLSTNPNQCSAHISDNALQKVETFKHTGAAFTSDRRQNKEIDARIGRANTALREFYCSVVSKQELSNTAELSVFSRSLIRY